MINIKGHKIVRIKTALVLISFISKRAQVMEDAREYCGNAQSEIEFKTQEDQFGCGHDTRFI